MMRVIQNPIDSIGKHPTTIDKKHESLYRSYHILFHVIEMLHRGDSQKTILEVIQHMQNINPQDQEGLSLTTACSVDDLYTIKCADDD